VSPSYPLPAPVASLPTLIPKGSVRAGLTVAKAAIGCPGCNQESLAMTLSYGREYLAIPGPSVMPDRVLRAMNRASPNIYEGDLIDMVKKIIAAQH
jgi:hypothetical protein